MNEGSENTGKGGVNSDFTEEVMQILTISYRWGIILKDLVKDVYHNHVKPEIQYRIRDLSLYPDKIVKDLRESEKE